MTNEEAVIDRIDLKILDVLQIDGRAGAALWQLPGVRETRTYAEMEEVKCTTRLDLGL